VDVHLIRQLESELASFLGRFGDCFAREDTRAHLGVHAVWPSRRSPLDI
jgi:hypothetical protein